MVVPFDSEAAQTVVTGAEAELPARYGFLDASENGLSAAGWTGQDEDWEGGPIRCGSIYFARVLTLPGSCLPRPLS